MDPHELGALVGACRGLLERRPPGEAGGAAAMLTASGMILLGSAPDALNPAVELCHETEPYCAAYRLGESIVATVCLYRDLDETVRVLAPCGVCQERLATHGPEVLAAVPKGKGMTVEWVALRDLMPHYWLTVFEDVPGDWAGA
ncbi:cytidine deaminase [Micrococcus luteus]